LKFVNADLVSFIKIIQYLDTVGFATGRHLASKKLEYWYVISGELTGDLHASEFRLSLPQHLLPLYAYKSSIIWYSGISLPKFFWKLVVKVHTCAPAINLNQIQGTH